MSTQIDGTDCCEEDRFSPIAALFNISLTIFLMMLFNVFPQRIGMVVSASDPDSFIPLFNPEFLDAYLPWFNAWWGLALSLNFVLLGLRRWTVATRWADFGLTLFGLSILLKVANAGPILNPGNEWIVEGLPWLEIGEGFTMALVLSLNWTVWVITMAVAIGAIVKFVQLVRMSIAGVQPQPA